MLSGHK
jgi:hypothetical protein